MIKVTCSNLDNIINKFDKITNDFDISECLDSSQQLIINELQIACSWAPKAAACIGLVNESKKKNHFAYKRIGLGQPHDFSEYKNAYFHNYGYNLVFFGHKTNRFIDMHKMWFDNAVQQLKAPVTRMVREEIKKKLEGAL